MDVASTTPPPHPSASGGSQTFPNNNNNNNNNNHNNTTKTAAAAAAAATTTTITTTAAATATTTKTTTTTTTTTTTKTNVCQKPQATQHSSTQKPALNCWTGAVSTTGFLHSGQQSPGPRYTSRCPSAHAAQRTVLQSVTRFSFVEYRQRPQHHARFTGGTHAVRQISHAAHFIRSARKTITMPHHP